jgi:glutamyl-tRNA synthetase
LLNIGSSNDVIAEKNIEVLVNNFNLKNISSSSSKFSKEVLKSLNKDILQSYKSNEISFRIIELNKYLPQDKLWQFAKNNINFFLEIRNWIDVINSENNVFEKNIDKNFLDIAIETLPKEPFNEETWDTWTNLIKNKTGLKGKDLFMPLRIALTGKDKGPELKYLLPLLNKKLILKKFGKI